MKMKYLPLMIALLISGCSWPGVDNAKPHKNNPYYGQPQMISKASDYTP
jgi:hypothetical protein